MGSSSGNSWTCTKSQSFGSEEDLQVVMDERKNKRKQSNRESARRSRVRKQNHLEELTKQVSQLTRDNREILASIEITTQHYVNVEAQNSILRAQIGELSQRLQSLNEMLNIIINTAATAKAARTTTAYERDCYLTTSAQNFMNMMPALNLPITANSDIFQW